MPTAATRPSLTTGGRRALGLFSAATVAVGSVVLSSGVAQAALPTLPNNLVVFPDRDFMTIEGFEGLPAGSTATVKVFRGTTVVGQTTADVNYPEDGVAFEINHPGGACWGQGAPSGLNVTPDITGNDRVELTINGQVFDMPVADISVASESISGSTVTVISDVPAAIPLDRLEARIIQPDLKDTAVARRDARAVADGTGDEGYTSTLARSTTNPDQVVATYTFLDDATAQTALGGTSRIMSWAAADGDERSGITIAEHGEVGGPGMGGCPAGPGDAAQPGPGEAGFVRSANGESMTVNWVAAPPVAGGAPVSGYHVTLTDPDGNMVGKKVGASAIRADFTGLTATTEYLVEVRAAQGTGADTVLSKPYAAASGAPDQNPETGDVTDPTVTLTPNAETGEITVTANEAVDVYYTLDGSDVVDIDMPSLTAIHLPEGATIPVTAAGTVVKVAAFDAAGNIGTAEGTYEPGTSGPAPTLPGAPTGVSTQPGQGSLVVSWTAPEQTGASAISRYEVTATPATGTAVSAVVVAPATTATLTGLTAGTAYTVSVIAVNDQGSSPAGTATGTPDAVTNDTVTITGGRYRAGDRLEVNGTGTIAGATITIRSTSATGPVIGTAIVAPPAAGATFGTWTFAVRNAVPAVPGSQVWVESDKGGKAGPYVLRR
ncbi:fibronectin type III domain-containing protein [Geodermatophilus sp. SYSU D00705]